MLFRIPDNIIVIAIPYKPIRAYRVYLSAVLLFFLFTDIVYLINLKNKLIAEGRYTDAVDELLCKVISTKKKKIKVKYI